MITRRRLMYGLPAMLCGGVAIRSAVASLKPGAEEPCYLGAVSTYDPAQWQVDSFCVPDAQGLERGMLIDVNLNGQHAQRRITRIERLEDGGMSVFLEAA